MAEGLVPGLVYLGMFGLGVTLGMSLFAIVAALAMRRAAERSIAIGRRIGMGAGWLSMVVGGVWIIGALTR
jgi:hypothetical protein